MEIGRLKENDLAPLSIMFQQFWGEKSSPEKMRSTFSRIKTNPAYILLVAKQKKRLMGFGMGIICEELYGDCKPFMVIEDLIVDKNQRRSGVGAALMAAFEKCAFENNCCQIIFVTEAEREETLKFYRSLGYDHAPYKGFKKRIKPVKNISET